MAASSRSSMKTHPDILDMRERHEMAERASTTPRAQAIETLALLTGLYLAASPWIAGFNGLTTLAVNNLILGIAYALLMSGGFGRAYERTHGMAWACCACARRPVRSRRSSAARRRCPGSGCSRPAWSGR